MEYAIIETGGKQYKVNAGTILFVDKLSATNEIMFDHVLLHVNGDNAVEVGKPYLESVVVSGKVLGQVLGDKIHVRRFTAKSRHRRHVGFRAALTKVEITGISSSKAKKKDSKTVKSDN